jgi:CO/xanthine dehydrogenase Mo-binding subunit
LGAPQTFFAVETMMDHIAYDLGVEPLEFKERQLVKQNDATSTSGIYHFPSRFPRWSRKWNR